ncbi:MAG: hypothetical protein CM15mP84_07910 [Cellvibrionales bacterium]|nr:MAG: hypothetical protein CM15mP84_07910 [Cellvibrionales bacterium]
MLTRAQVDENDTVLITGASGGAESAAIQLAKARGARVLAVAGESKHESELDAGAQEVPIRGCPLQDQLGDNGVDVVIDLAGGPNWPELLNV